MAADLIHIDGQHGDECMWLIDAWMMEGRCAIDDDVGWMADSWRMMMMDDYGGFGVLMATMMALPMMHAYEVCC